MFLYAKRKIKDMTHLLLKKQWSDITLATKSGKVNNWLCDEK